MKTLIKKTLERLEAPFAYRIIFADGDSISRGGDAPVLVVRIHNENCFVDWITRRSLGFGETYMRGDFDLETGDLQDLIRLGFLAEKSLQSAGLWFKLRTAFDAYRRRNTIPGSRRNIAAHYDLGNDFYRAWLDRAAMQYTCAYFVQEQDSLEQAQFQKMDLVCRKLRLKPGDRVVEAGSGWGGLALHAAEHYGVRIRSYNISREQVAFAREESRRRGLSGQVEFILDDYRTISSEGEQYDKFISVGMLEHVGRENFEEFFNIIRSSLKPMGLALVHSICRTYPRSTDPWLEKYIFPGSYMPSLAEVSTAAEEQDFFHTVDVENLRYHYALTLDHWSRRFEERAAEFEASFGVEFVRMWRFYLRSSAAAFRYSGITLLQFLFSNGLETNPPLTRRHFLLESAQPGRRSVA